MKTRNLILPGIALVVLAMLATTVFAGEYDVEAPKDPRAPQVYLLKKVFDICNPGLIVGGSVPPSGQQFGCVDFLEDYRWNEYAFTGERIAELVAVRDLDGDIDILGAYLQVNGVDVVKCNQMYPNGQCKLKTGQTDPADRTCASITDKVTCDTYPVKCEWDPDYIWYTHVIDLTQIPQKGPAPVGYDPRYDKLYECILTVTDNLPAPTGEFSEVAVRAYDEAAECGWSPVQEWYFNPEIVIDIYTNDGQPVTFEDAFGAGQTVYSVNTLKINNDAEGGVDLYVWIAGSDLTSPDVASKCPLSNVLESDNIEYRCKIGTIFNNPWNHLVNPNDKHDCTMTSCQDATPLIPDAANPMFNVLGNSHTAECWFRLNWPVPCVGDFTEGTIYIYARAI